MAWDNGFYNSVNGDRVYNADQLSSIFTGLITNGVYESVGNKLAVQPNSGMTIQIATGRGWFNNRWVNNNSEYLITLEASDVMLNRYAAICIRNDETNGVRATTPYVKYSEFATNPTKPTMTRTVDVKEYCLAYVYIRAKATAITASDIEDTRGNTDLCGWVTGLIEQLDSTTLFEQFRGLFEDFMAANTDEFNTWLNGVKVDFDDFIVPATRVFNEWFEGLVDIIDDNVETMLVNALPANVTVTLTTGGWLLREGVYTQTVTVVGMNETKGVLVAPDSAVSTQYSKFNVNATTQAFNSLTFTATTLPTVDLSVNIMYMGR